ncbi:hypothetical protein NIES4075_49410 [Tolypothrix sp. NIES-4075]|uniref:hypothetical protein n=1 Tax=Tolypothrix sp. NIES-4075 TaxID=2005459 RepID=UPI000B5C3508|nr:hypothetical protein [Tolypothrix sp. NIES-4075]GAX43926.1 hypothetical protein NIES4075_49410 [Tolypothrix sp. NIES-4075]
MSELSEILSLLEAERDRYVLEVIDLERRLSLVRKQITTLEALISGYALEEQMYQPQRRISDSSSSTAVLLNSQDEIVNSQHEIEEDDIEEDSQTASQLVDSTAPAEKEPDISDIPKLTIARKPGTLPLLEEFQDYSIQNAILILMRRRPELHFHVDAIVRDLYGDQLTSSQLKTAKTNVSKMLSTGVQMGLWYRVFRALGVYTLHYEKGVTTKSIGK